MAKDTSKGKNKGKEEEVKAKGAAGKGKDKGKDAGKSKKKEQKEQVIVSKSTLIEEVAEATEVSKKDTTEVVNTFIDKIQEHVAAGEQVQLKGFASFGYRVKDARTGRNPQTGEEIEIKEQPVTYAKVGREFKRNVKEAYAG